MFLKKLEKISSYNESQKLGVVALKVGAMALEKAEARNRSTRKLSPRCWKIEVAAPRSDFGNLTILDFSDLPIVSQNL